MRPMVNDPYAPQRYGGDPYGLGRLRSMVQQVVPGATVEYDTTPLRKRPDPPLRIWYDCEFVEDGRTIDLLSIGMVSEDGRTLYRVNGDYTTMNRAVQRDWLRENVVKHLPVRVEPGPGPGQVFSEHHWTWSADHPDAHAVRYRAEIRDDVRAFIADSMKVFGYDGVRLWAWYGAYDHVCYAQLFGKMVDLPGNFPMWTNDLKQEVDRLGNPELPATNQAEHNALADAQELRYRHLWLDGRAV